MWYRQRGIFVARIYLWDFELRHSEVDKQNQATLCSLGSIFSLWHA